MDSSNLFFDRSASLGNMLFLGNSALFQGPRTIISMEENPARKRLFFTSPDDFTYDEEYYVDEQLPEKKRRLTPEQVIMLEKSFDEENKLEPERKTELAKRLGLQPRQVAVWFQNRRARSKTKQLERDYDILRASYDGLRLNYETLVKETDKLRAEVRLLTEKIQAKNEYGQEGPTQFSPIQEFRLDEPNKEAQQQNNKAEDRLSSGSSVVENPNLVVDSTGDSYFDCLPHPPLSSHCIPTVSSEEDDINDDGQSNYLSCMFAGVEAPEYREEEEEDGGQDMGWWVWS